MPGESSIYSKRDFFVLGEHHMLSLNESERSHTGTIITPHSGEVHWELLPSGTFFVTLPLHRVEEITFDEPGTQDAEIAIRIG